ncbi:MAG TPA: YggS family pyridoxal phosphate-dependent enzyme [Candidatus Thermoplasmatota archaeon]|nr:YggS family pyridoxal phosphate-dependent enzyme [Candidatus Thermoplasmatota archaeon]
MSLQARYRVVAARVAERARLVAVSKAASVDDIRALYALGQRDFGENRADQLAERAAQLPDDVRWHFIGNIQSNKLRVLAQVRPLVHSFDRLDLVAKWPRDVRVLLQVDFTGRADRNGIPPAAVADALATLRKADVAVEGVATLPPADADPRPVFRALRALRDEHALRELSMGMSDDYEVALEEGATMVRVGRAIFEER